MRQVSQAVSAATDTNTIDRSLLGNPLEQLGSQIARWIRNRSSLVSGIDTPIERHLCEAVCATFLDKIGNYEDAAKIRSGILKDGGAHLSAQASLLRCAQQDLDLNNPSGARSFLQALANNSMEPSTFTMNVAGTMYEAGLVNQADKIISQLYSASSNTLAEMITFELKGIPEDEQVAEIVRLVKLAGHACFEESELGKDAFLCAAKLLTTLEHRTGLQNFRWKEIIEGHIAMDNPNQSELAKDLGKLEANFQTLDAERVPHWSLKLAELCYLAGYEDKAIKYLQIASDASHKVCSQDVIVFSVRAMEISRLCDRLGFETQRDEIFENGATILKEGLVKDPRARALLNLEAADTCLMFGHRELAREYMSKVSSAAADVVIPFHSQDLLNAIRERDVARIDDFKTLRSATESYLKLISGSPNELHEICNQIYLTCRFGDLDGAESLRKSFENRVSARGGITNESPDPRIYVEAMSALARAQFNAPGAQELFSKAFESIESTSTADSLSLGRTILKDICHALNDLRMEREP